MAELLRVLRELRGVPLSVWIALKCVKKGPVRQNWIARNTGYSDKPVREALRYLVEHGFAARVKGGWMILIESPAPSAARLAAEQLEALEENTVAEANWDRYGQNRKNSDSAISINKEGFKDSKDSNNTNSENRKFSDFPDVGQALMDAGIMENKRTRSLLGRISVRDVRTMVNRVRDDPYHDLSETGWMVAILEGTAQHNERRGGYESWNSG